MTVYEQMKEAGVPMDSHATDLYVKATPEAETIAGLWEFAHNVTRFRSQIDGEIWLDLPFAYDPAWNAKRKEGAEN